ncbi:MAG: PepSY domain-containing protein [Devosia sp.]
MIKLSLIGATGLAVLVAGLSVAPASAAQTVASFCSTSNPEITKDADRYEMLLKQQGVDVSDIREWGGCIQAFVTDASGSTHLAYYDPLTLKEIPFDLNGVTAG